MRRMASCFLFIGVKRYLNFFPAAAAIYTTGRKLGDFKTGGRYLLFLEFIPQTASYKAAGEKSFLLNGKQVVLLLRDNPHPGIEGQDTETLINDTAAAIAAQGPHCLGREKQ